MNNYYLLSQLRYPSSRGMVSSKNYVFGMHSDMERYSWAAVHLFVLLSSLVGDTLIFYATFQKNTFKLNKFIVTVIQYIAASDLAYSMVTILPRAGSLLANSRILGDYMCCARVYLGYFFYSAGMWLIATLTMSKFLLLKFPIRFPGWAKKNAHRICSFTIVPSITLPILFMIVDKDDIVFDYRYCACEYALTASIWKQILAILTIVLNVSQTS